MVDEELMFKDLTELKIRNNKLSKRKIGINNVTLVRLLGSDIQFCSLRI